MGDKPTNGVHRMADLLAGVAAWLYVRGRPPALRLYRAAAPRVLRAWDKARPFVAPVARLFGPAGRWAHRKVLEHIAAGDPVFARAFTWSFAVHFLVVFLSLLPVLFEAFGCVRPVDTPAGTGLKAGPQARKIQVRVRRWIVNPMSAIRLDFPQADKVVVDLERKTEHPWTGAAGGGGAPGFRGGAAGGAIPFIRLKHGGDWDNDIDADDNMLRVFGELTGIAVRGRAETLSVRKLLDFPRMRSPPFVYIYGTRVCGLTDTEMVVLRRYLADRGGMLIADAGGPGFDSSFRTLLNRLFPDQRLLDIPNDDPIYQSPFSLPNGAPALWHHGGRRALGLRYEGRLVVFYHPGDMNDAWKTDHSGARRDVWEAAYQLGTNLIYHAVSQYLRFTGRQ